MNNPLSCYNSAYELQRYICDTVNLSSQISSLGVEMIAENEMDVEYRIKQSIQKQGMSLVLMTPSVALQGNDGERNALVMDGIEIQCVEYVPVNRAKNKQTSSTALDVCTYLQEFITGRNSPFGYGSFSFVNIEQGEQDGLLVCSLRLKTYMVPQSN